MFEMMMLICFLVCSLIGLLPRRKSPKAKRPDSRSVAKPLANISSRPARVTRSCRTHAKICGARKIPTAGFAILRSPMRCDSSRSLNLQAIHFAIGLRR